jgi:hypothetical protein
LFIVDFLVGGYFQLRHAGGWCSSVVTVRGAVDRALES